MDGRTRPEQTSAKDGKHVAHIRRWTGSEPQFANIWERHGKYTIGSRTASKSWQISSLAPPSICFGGSPSKGPSEARFTPSQLAIKLANAWNLKECEVPVALLGEVSK